jgi:hypothetical protein
MKPIALHKIELLHMRVHFALRSHDLFYIYKRLSFQPGSFLSKNMLQVIQKILAFSITRLLPVFHELFLFIKVDKIMTHSSSSVDCLVCHNVVIYLKVEYAAFRMLLNSL